MTKCWDRCGSSFQEGLFNLGEETPQAAFVLEGCPWGGHELNYCDALAFPIRDIWRCGAIGLRGNIVAERLSQIATLTRRTSRWNALTPGSASFPVWYVGASPRQIARWSAAQYIRDSSVFSTLLGGASDFRWRYCAVMSIMSCGLGYPVVFVQSKVPQSGHISTSCHFSSHMREQNRAMFFAFSSASSAIGFHAHS